MRFNVSSKALYSHASAVSKVINSKNAMTILYNFLFVLKGNELTITASDIENTLSATIEVTEAEGEGMFCVDARKVVELLKELPDQGIKFDVNDSNYAIEITYLNGRYNLIGYNGLEFPNEQDADPAILEFKCPAKQILSGIDNTLFAVGTDDLWPQMMGILWDLSPESITFVSTDSRKLVKYQNTESAPGVEGSFILPVKPANILKNILSGADKEVAVSANAKSATFTSGGYTFNCRFIKGNFPDYNRVIPRNNPYSLTVDRVSFLNALKRVAIFVEQGHGLVKFKIEPDKIILKAQDNTLCTSGIETVACSFTGESMVIGFSAVFIIDIFSTLKSDEIEVKLSDPSRPGLFVPCDKKEDSELLMLLMPMTVTDF